MKKLILFLITASLLSACTLRVCTPTYVSYDGIQQYACVDKRVGSAKPIITYINQARQMSRR